MFGYTGHSTHWRDLRQAPLGLLRRAKCYGGNLLLEIVGRPRVEWARTGWKGIMAKLKKNPALLAPGPGALHQRIGSQSVRTSFRMSPGAVDALSWMAQRFGTTQKEILRQIVADLVALEAQSPRRFASLVRRAKAASGDSSVRRAYVVPNDALDMLKGIARRSACSRDAILQEALRTYFDATSEAEDSLRASRGRALQIIRGAHQRATHGDAALRELLDAGDPIAARFSAIVDALADLERDLAHELDPDMPDWSPADSAPLGDD